LVFDTWSESACIELIQKFYGKQATPKSMVKTLGGKLKNMLKA
jgi:hypothetical protein